jgi:hypothetical protein
MSLSLRSPHIQADQSSIIHPALPTAFSLPSTQKALLPQNRPSGIIARKPLIATEESVSTSDVVIPTQGNVPVALLGILQQDSTITSSSSQTTAHLTSSTLPPPTPLAFTSPEPTLFPTDQGMTFEVPLDFTEMGAAFPVEETGMDWADFFQDAEAEGM